MRECNKELGVDGEEQCLKERKHLTKVSRVFGEWRIYLKLHQFDVEKGKVTYLNDYLKHSKPMSFEKNDNYK